MMLKISQKMRHTSSTLKIEGMAPNRALTTTYTPNTQTIAIHTDIK